MIKKPNTSKKQSNNRRRQLKQVIRTPKVIKEK